MSGRLINSNDRSKIKLLAEERVNYTDSDIDNLISKAYRVFNPKMTQSEFKVIINNSKQ